MTEDTPLITVGVPTFNRAKYLREALESLLAQSYRNLEIIVGDNDSKDDTAEVCREYAAKDPRVKVIRHPRNIGMVANHNCILEQARGKYFVWACDDDLWLPDFIKVMSQLLSEHDGAVTAMCRCADIVQGAQVAHPPKDFDNGETAYQSLLRYARTGDYLPICGMHETAVLKKIGGYHADSRPFFHCSDYITILRMALHGKLVYSNDVLFLKRDTGHAHNAFETLTALRLDRGTALLMFRYACFPLFYVYNLVFCIRSVAGSELLPCRKLRVIVSLVGYYVRSNAEFGLNVVRGVCALVVGGARWMWHRVGR